MGHCPYVHTRDQGRARASASLVHGVPPAETTAPVRNLCSCIPFLYFYNFVLAYTVCAAGSYETSAPSATANRQCSACPAGYYCTGPSPPQGCGSATLYAFGSASSCSMVSSGFYSTPTDVSASFRTGQSACMAGSYCIGGVSNVCGVNTYQPIIGQVSCLSCPGCTTGLNQTMPCSTTAATICKGKQCFCILYS